MPRVSLIIATHDRAQLLERALRSVLAQTRRPDEVIVVDDGSGDETAALVRERHPWVALLEQPHRGVSAARNRGIEAATGDWVAILDSDDEWQPRKLERQLEAISRAPAYRVCHTDEIWIRRGRRVNPARKHAKSGGQIFRACLPLCAISPSSVLLARTVLDEVGLFDESLPACEDYDLWLRVCARHPVLYLEEPLVIKHGGHADQLSARHWGMDRFRIHALEKILTRGALSPGDWEAARATLIRKIEIYLVGARKREKRAELDAYQAKLERWSACAPDRGSVTFAIDEGWNPSDTCGCESSS